MKSAHQHPLIKSKLSPLHKKRSFPAYLVTFTEEILNGKLYFLCSVSESWILSFSRKLSNQWCISKKICLFCTFQNNFSINLMEVRFLKLMRARIRGIKQSNLRLVYSTSQSSLLFIH